jgi:hypothetical protein
VNLFGLLYLSGNSRQVNLRRSSDAVSTYIRCASVCARSAKSVGNRFTLLTNSEERIRDSLVGQNLSPLDVREISFALDVPNGIPFYEAHYKLELLSAFGTGAFGERPALVDIDALFLRRFRESADFEVYDISEQAFPAYGRERVVADLELIAGRKLPGARWYGGEYICGQTEDFRLLSGYIEACWGRYKSLIGRLHHTGDEIVTSAALNCAFLDGLKIVDMGIAGGVARWWSARTLTRQVSFDEAQRAAFLHLPADKEFLSAVAIQNFDSEEILKLYRSYVRKKIAVRKVQNLLDKCRGRGKYVPSIAKSSA